MCRLTDMFVDHNQRLNGGIANRRCGIAEQQNDRLNVCFERQRLCAISKTKYVCKNTLVCIFVLRWFERGRDTYRFSVSVMVYRNSSRILAFLCLKHGVSLSSSCCGCRTWLSSSLASNSWAFSRTVSRESPSRSTTCGKTVGVYTLKSWPSRPISSTKASSDFCAI